MKLRFNLAGFEFTPDYFNKLLGVIHKWLGNNDVHDKTSLYTFSNIHNNSFTFASYDKELLKTLAHNSLKSKDMFNNTKLKGIDFLRIRTDKEIFKCASPFFIKDKEGNHLIYKDAENRAKEILQHKAKLAGVELGDFTI